jgi:hypothetical protein
VRLLVPAPFEEAVASLRSRGLMATAMSSAEIREMGAEARRGAFFSARTTHARYLQDQRDVVDRILSGELSKSEAKEILQTRLVEYGYDPSRGFLGDESLGIPAAKRNSIRDLGSSARLDLILDTQVTLHRSMGQKIQGMRPAALYAFPCWELVRMRPRRIPRGSALSRSIGWPERWDEAGGRFYGGGRMIAAKADPVWAALGDSSRWDDALDVDVPPFAFNSGFSWLAVPRDECLALGVIGADSPQAAPAPELRAAIGASVKGIDPALIRAALAGMLARKRRGG